MTILMFFISNFYFVPIIITILLATISLKLKGSHQKSHQP